MLKQTKAGKVVSEEDIPPPVAVPASSSRPSAAPSDMPQQALSKPATISSDSPIAPTRQAPSASVSIPRPSVISGGQAAAAAPVPKPRTSVESSMQQPAGSGPGINVAKAAVNAPPLQLHTGPASHHSADQGGM